ncbi:short-chain dehydrogenase/reductase [Sphaerulina musiva SO2202]|uniref:Short-chain dehydrogenase/reductase n=1 Tax=Sphaerulina musiva (strain SO2202) TaxID=692275 RepID=N1QG41_SPHMS|nr:short-chain dehydrogenase/reductase [Sphaerulina musiva SO2202]EMF09518.1 short-chain dehydrogenase/reductase [Sphaerulina musiva SO2202]
MYLATTSSCKSPRLSSPLVLNYCSQDRNPSGIHNKMYMGLEKKVVLITGGTKGIGRSIVRAFLKEGATVHFCSRTASDVQAANETYRKDYPDSKAIGAVVDVTNKDKLTQWVNSTAQESSKIHIVIANVSSLSIEDSVENWHTAFQTDLMGTYHLIQAALPHLEKSRGNIVTISSVSGRDVDFTAPGPYPIMKAGLIHYTAGLAHTLASKGVRANTVSPGNIYIEDGAWGNIEKKAPELFASQMALNPMGRMGKPEEVADACVFLASERASFISGTNLVVDGSLCTGTQF